MFLCLIACGLLCDVVCWLDVSMGAFCNWCLVHMTQFLWIFLPSALPLTVDKLLDCSLITTSGICHHVSWDEYAQGMPRGAELYNWVEENEMAVLNDGKPTRAARFQQGYGLSAPDITIVNSEAADRFSWQPLNELSSDHSPILIKWNQLVKTERAQRRV